MFSFLSDVSHTSNTEALIWTSVEDKCFPFTTTGTLLADIIDDKRRFVFFDCLSLFVDCLLDLPHFDLAQGQLREENYTPAIG